MYKPKEIAESKEIILEGMVQGKSLLQVLKDDTDMFLPSRTIIYTWLNPENKNYDPEFLNNYARAASARADVLVEQTIELADAQDDVTYFDKFGNSRVDWGKVQRNKTQIEARQWAAARMAPKKYGTKVETTLQGGDKPVELVDYTKLSTQALEEIAKHSNAGKSKSE